MTDTIVAPPPVADPVTPPVAADPPAAPVTPPVVTDPPAADPPAADAADWRTEYAGGDEKLAKFLGKFTDPKALAVEAKKNRDALMQRAASKLPENPTDEEIAAFRKEQGIPEKPEGYLEKLPQGLVVGDDDRPAVDTFLSKMHASNAPKGAVDAALGAYYELVEQQESAEITRIAEAKEAGILALRDEWGADYKRNLNAVSALFQTMPADVSSALSDGTDGNGLPLSNNPAVIQWLASLSLEQNPLNTVVPGAGANQASAVADEIAKLEGMMGDRQSAYWKGPEAAKHQARFVELVSAREKMNGR